LTTSTQRYYGPDAVKGSARSYRPVRLRTMVSEVNGSETVVTGLLEDRPTLLGVLAQIEALGAG
jgi:hypothetical protein